MWLFITIVKNHMNSYGFLSMTIENPMNSYGFPTSLSKPIGIPMLFEHAVPSCSLPLLTLFRQPPVYPFGLSPQFLSAGFFFCKFDFNPFSAFFGMVLRLL